MYRGDLDKKDRPVVTEENELEFGDEPKSLAYLKDSDYQKSEARMRMNTCLNAKYLIRLNVCIETTLEEITPVVTEKHEFEFRNEKLKKHPSIVGSDRILIGKTS